MIKNGNKDCYVSINEDVYNWLNNESKTAIENAKKEAMNKKVNKWRIIQTHT